MASHVSFETRRNELADSVFGHVISGHLSPEGADFRLLAFLAFLECRVNKLLSLPSRVISTIRHEEDLSGIIADIRLAALGVVSLEMGTENRILVLREEVLRKLAEVEAIADFGRRLRLASYWINDITRLLESSPPDSLSAPHRHRHVPELLALFDSLLLTRDELATRCVPPKFGRAWKELADAIGRLKDRLATREYVEVKG